MLRFPTGTEQAAHEAEHWTRPNAEIDRDEAAARRAIAELERQIADANRSHVAKWGDNDGDSRRYQGHEYHLIVAPAHERALRELRDRMTPHRTMIEFEAPRLRRRLLEDYEPLSASLTVLAIDVPSIESDRGLAGLAAERNQRETSRSNALEAIESIRPLIDRLQTRADDSALAAQHGVVPAAEAATDAKRLADALARRRTHDAVVTETDAEIARIDRAADERRTKLEADVTAKISALIPGAVRDAADAVLATLEATNRLRWLLQEPLAPDVAISAPNLSFADVKRFLEAAHAAGWRPAKGDGQ